MDWNIIATIARGPGHAKRVLDGLWQFGEFHASSFTDVCYGRVEDVHAFLDAILGVRQQARPWARHVARLIPIERHFRFDAENFADQLKEAVTPFATRMGTGRFFVRIERRGMQGRVHGQEVERAIADHLVGLLEARGERLATDFEDPDWIVVCETLGAEAGVALLGRELRRRYPFVQVH